MRKKIMKLSGVCAVVCIAVLGIGAAFQEKDIARLKQEQEKSREVQHMAIIAGYMACQNGIPLADYLKAVDEQLNVLYAKQLREATNQ